MKEIQDFSLCSDGVVIRHLSYIYSPLSLAPMAVEKIKIATGDDVLSNSWFCLVNWRLGIFGPRPGGG